MVKKPAAPLILASQSRARQAMLTAAGLSFTTKPAAIDEEKIIAALTGKNADINGIALVLAEEKARKIALENKGALVIGADQILECDRKILTKAETPEQAREKLRFLRGKTHRLISAVTVIQDGHILWHHVENARLTMHAFDEAFLDAYCAAAGQALTRSVGAYELEGTGVWLFSAIDGDYFTILGMPLLPLLTFLKDHFKIGPGG